MKTTIIGVLTIVSAIVGAALQFLKSGNADWQTTVVTVIAGIGFIKAADAPAQ